MQAIRGIFRTRTWSKRLWTERLLLQHAACTSHNLRVLLKWFHSQSASLSSEVQAGPERSQAHLHHLASSAQPYQPVSAKEPFSFQGAQTELCNTAARLLPWIVCREGSPVCLTWSKTTAVLWRHSAAAGFPPSRVRRFLWTFLKAALWFQRICSLGFAFLTFRMHISSDTNCVKQQRAHRNRSVQRPNTKGELLPTTPGSFRQLWYRNKRERIHYKALKSFFPTKLFAFFTCSRPAPPREVPHLLLTSGFVPQLIKVFFSPLVV